MSGAVGTNLLAQVGFIVKDVRASKKKWAEFLGVPEPPIVPAGDYAVTQTVVDGQPAPEADCEMAFFDVGPGMQIELIQPNEASSTWRNFLNAHGEGVHHLALNVTGMKMQQAVENCKDFGMTVLQKGEYGSGDGRYTYLDATNSLKVVLELLESDHK